MNQPYNQLYRYMFLPWDLIAAEFQRVALLEEHGKLLDLEQRWQDLSSQMARVISQDARSTEASWEEKLPDDQSEQLNTVRADSTFRTMFRDASIHLALVGIDDLIAPQHTLNLDHIGQLQRSWKDHMELPDLIRLCLSPRCEDEAPFEWHRTQDNPLDTRYELRSPNPNVRGFDVVQVDLSDEEIEDFQLPAYPATAMMVIAGFGSNPIRIDRVGERRVLANGFHRVYALRSLGMKAIPAVVRDVQDFERDCGQTMHAWPTATLFTAPRPPLFKDFFSPFTVQFRVQQPLPTWELTWRRTT